MYPQLCHLCALGGLSCTVMTLSVNAVHLNVLLLQGCLVSDRFVSQIKFDLLELLSR